MSDYNALVVGAGFAGAVCARKLAETGAMSVLLLEQRTEIGGNAYDCIDEHGLLIHKYGPHIFHTGSKPVFDFLSRFTEWRDYEHRVVANVHGTQMPVPFNLDSLRLAFGEARGAALEDRLLAAYGPERKVSILELRSAADPELEEVAAYIYENVFLHYTMKQWGSSPEEIDPETINRVPVFLSRDDRYFQDSYQGIPTDGYTVLFARMLDHPGITLCQSIAANTRLRLENGVTYLDGLPFSGPVIYTGALDELFDRRYGPLPYRSLDFRFETHDTEWYQSHATVNYTVSEDFTRITEFKRLTGQLMPDKTTIVKEFPRDYGGGPEEIPCYPVLSPQSRALYGQYRSLAAGYPNLHPLGRLGEYQYYNMDAITAQALSLCETLLPKN